jgi:hypothetical protein
LAAAVIGGISHAAFGFISQSVRVQAVAFLVYATLTATLCLFFRPATAGPISLRFTGAKALAASVGILVATAAVVVLFYYCLGSIFGSLPSVTRQIVSIATDAGRLKGQPATAWIIAIARGCLLVPVFEEVFFRGLLLGWPKTCGGYEGSLGHEALDAQMYADWGIDFLKYDLCSFWDNLAQAKAAHPDDPHAARDVMIAAYKKMGDALNATGRPILYSLCQYGVDQPWKWGPGVGAQMWRTTDDIDDSYGRMVMIGFSQAGLSKYAGPGHWNAPDMLEVGNGKMTEDEYKTHMSLWVILAAPLLAGNDLSKMTDADKSILMNKDAIAIDQDPLGKQGDRLYQSADLDVWTKPLSNGRIAVGLFNRSWGDRDISVDLSEIGFPSGATLRDVWKQTDLGHRSGVFTSTVPHHGVTAHRQQLNS